ncbi:MAG: HAD-IIB family hydrolase [Coprobacillus cateniformis]|uniref:HAD-IIB family hydrolase n=1 Tax=Longibaculum muris TaxID=1796628 RepID=UPI003AB45D56|nr:HAD-IIB family hydrolase [Coprobacillus cateniformis]
MHKKEFKQKILFTDLDGTLVFDGVKKRYTNKRDVEAIRKFQEAGHLIGTCTGRGLGTANNGCEDVKFDFYIVNSGAGIYNKDKKELYYQGIDKTLVKDIMDCIGHHAYIFVYKYNSYFMNFEYNDEFPIVQSIDNFSDNVFDSFSVVAHNNTEKIESIYKIVKDQFGDRISMHQNKDSIDFVAKGHSKGQGIIDFINIYDKDIKDINVIGDSFNDIEMFKVCKQSYTFHSSHKDVKKYTYHLVNNLAECIDQIMEETK